MEQRKKQACVFGGTGFIGRQVIRALAKQGYTVRVATRTPEKAYFLKTCGSVGQVVPFACNYADDASLSTVIKGCDVVINCIGILYEKQKNEFSKLQATLPERMAKTCKALGVSRFIHLSALGCEHSTSRYARTKMEGEHAVMQTFKEATILRPSVVFGAEDSFFNKFAGLSVVLPFLPLIGGGKTCFQPVYVGDIAQAVLACLNSSDTMGKIYELGGPEVLSFKEIYTKLFEQTGRKKLLLPLPWVVAKLNGAVLGLLPCPILTADQVESLKTDSVVGSSALTLESLGITATPMSTILPAYLARYRPGGRFGAKKRA